jgi:hypothetical protein
MDIRLLLRLVSRFWYLAILGVLLAVAATIFSAARLETSNWQLKYRQQLQYQSTAVLLVDGNRPSWLYAVPPGSSTPTGTSSAAAAAAAAAAVIADPARLGGLTSLYGYFVQSDAVRKLTGNDPINSVSSVTITADVGNGRREPLPLLAVTATGASPHAATDLARRVTKAFQRYVVQRQTKAHVATQDRVTLQIVNKASLGTRVAPRSYTRSIVAGLLTLIATIGLMLLLENLRPSQGESDEAAPEPSPSPDSTRALRYRNRTSTGQASIATIGTGTAPATALGSEPARRLAPPG